MNPTKKFSLNHVSIGTRYSGSFHPEEWYDEPDNNEGSYWAQLAGQTLGEWKETARIGDEYEVGAGVYLARVE